MSDPVRVGSILERLHGLGITVSLDDFGTGYASLVHLKSLPVGEVKIDRSFVKQMQSDPSDAAIVASTIQLAHTLGMRVVAEGVEDDELWAAVTKGGCDLVQGYGLSRPVPAPELEPLLRTAAAGTAASA
jgi:EAL domain-containing protein (putative c-di-GMP-specific phosphodiesterase class I)